MSTLANTLSLLGQGVIAKGTVSVDLASMATLTGSEITLTITGAVLGDTVIMNPVAAGNTAGIIFGGARVSASNTVKMRVFNGSAGTIDESAQTWDYCLIRA
jgi:hypothetical protein